MLNKIMLGLCVIILLVTPVYAINTYDETSSISRIVGESPTEMLRQLQKNELNLNHATYYTVDLISDKDNILREQFNNNLEFHNLGWSFNDVQNSARSFNKNELFILESEGEPSKIKKGSGEIVPRDVLSWQLEGKDPLIMIDAPYSGIYLPKEDTFVSRLVRESPVIAPTSFNSQEFTKSLLCQLADDKTLGEVFKDARNFHYNGGSKSSQDNYIGLVLQSYQLYGNPREKIEMDWTEADKERIKRNYCKNYLENLAPNIEFLEQVGNYSKFRKHLVFEIPSHAITQAGEFSILTAENAFQNLEPNEIVEPIAVRKTHFPINTIITGYNLESVEAPVELEIPNLPSYMNQFIQRTCYEDSRDYKVEFENSYAKDNLDFIARIYPLEIINCTEGKIKLYTKFSYSVDYIPLSPVLINKINSPSSSPVKQPIDIDIEVMPLTNSIAAGSLAIFDQDNNKIWEQEITTENTNFKARILSEDQEGLYKYSIEFMQNNETLNYKEFSIETIILTPKAIIPTTAQSEEQIEINYESQLDSPFELETRYYLLHDLDVIQEGISRKTINPRENIGAINLNGLKKEDKSYTLTLELSYLGNQKTISYLLNTNNVPLSYTETKPVYLEGERIIIPYETVDADNDNVEVTVEDTRFTEESNTFVWQTNEGDAGDYNIRYSISDGIETIPKSFSIKIEKAPEIPPEEPEQEQPPIEEPEQPSPCVENFVCSEWTAECIEGKRTRECNDVNNCALLRYTEEQVCEIPPPPEAPQEPVESVSPEIISLVESIRESLAQDFTIVIEGPIKEEEQSEEQSSQPEEEKKLVIKEGTEPLIEIKINEDTSRIEVQNMVITKQEEDADKGFLIVSGLILPEELTKTVYVDIKDPSATGVCIKDAEIFSVDEISSDCNGESEILLQCNGEITNGYTCTITENKYKISGLKHSGVLESSIVLDLDEDGYVNVVDCNDRNTEVHPGAQETCNNRDDNCINGKDENVVETRSCGLGICTGGTQTRACTNGVWSSGWSACSTANLAREETCNNQDDNCNGAIDDGLTAIQQCSPWSKRDYLNNECGEQQCTDQCGRTVTNRIECSQRPYEDICTWSDKNGCNDVCGTETCIDNNGRSYTRNTRDCKEQIITYTIEPFYETAYCYENIDSCGRSSGRRPVDCEEFCPYLTGEWSDTGVEGPCGTRIIYNKCNPSLIKGTEEKQCAIGDIDKNECVNLDDFFFLADCINISYQEVCDLNGDRVADEKDVAVISQWMGRGICKEKEPEPVQKVAVSLIEGDINKDQCVDLDDIFLFADNLGKEYNADADLNKDNKVDMDDNKILQDNFGKGCEWENQTKKTEPTPTTPQRRGPVKSNPVASKPAAPDAQDYTNEACVDLEVFFKFADCYNSQIYNEKCDINNDEKIDQVDFDLFKEKLDVGCPENRVLYQKTSDSCKKWEELDEEDVSYIYTRKIKPTVSNSSEISVEKTSRTSYTIRNSGTNCANYRLSKDTNSKTAKFMPSNRNCRVTNENLLEPFNFYNLLCSKEDETTIPNTSSEETISSRDEAAKPVNSPINISSGCSPQTICSNWEYANNRGGGCGNQICTDSCGKEWNNYTSCSRVISPVNNSCIPSLRCSEWSSKGYTGELCGERKCTDSCGKEWDRPKSCSRVISPINNSCRAYPTCSEWPFKDFAGRGCGEQKCESNCGIEFFNYRDCPLI